MNLRRAKYIIRTYYTGFRLYLHKLGLSTTYLFFICISSLGILFLSYNIYIAVNRAELNYKIRVEEEKKRDELLTGGKELDERIEYLESVDYRRNYASDSLGLAEPGEVLFEIDDEVIDAISIDEENFDPVNLEDNEFWWKYILFGME